jgi:hypothetical protein
MTAMTTIAILPMFVLLGLAVGLVFLLIKAPKAAAALIGVLVVLFAIRFYRGRPSPQAVTYVQPVQPPTVSWQAPEAARAPIWSDAIEDEFKADLYPSKSSAARALGLQMVEAIRKTMADAEQSIRVAAVPQPAYQEIAPEFKRGMELKPSGMRCSIKPSREVDPNEMKVLFYISVPQMQGRLRSESRQITAVASLGDRQASETVQYAEKPWVENFAEFTSQRPQEQYVVARSNGSCTSENEARQQAMEDACRQLEQIVGKIGNVEWAANRSILQEGGFITDQFVQSFDGSAGKIWRQAMLLDVSSSKQSWLRNRVALTAQAAHLTWARQIGSAVGVLVLILVTYFFLNMATRGYYEWSLRIAGLVLAIIAVVVFLA